MIYLQTEVQDVIVVSAGYDESKKMVAADTLNVTADEVKRNIVLKFDNKKSAESSIFVLDKRTLKALYSMKIN